MKVIPYILILSYICLFSCQEEEKEDPKEVASSGGLKGIVKNSFDQPVSGVTIILLNQAIEKTTTTDENGLYHFVDIPAGDYQITAQSQVYQPYQNTITIVSNTFVFHDIALVSSQRQLQLSDTVIHALAVSGDTVVTINSNTVWSIRHSSEWVNTSLSQGEGNANVTVSWLENVSEEERMDTIYIDAPGEEVTLVVQQDYPLRLLHKEGIVRSDPDSALLLFNKPLKTLQVTSNTDYCLSDIDVDRVAGNRGIRFSYRCADAGNLYSFRVAVTDSAGNSFVENVDIPFYTRKVDIAGYVTDYLVEDDLVYLAAINPSRIIEYSLREDKVLREYDLSAYVGPKKIVLNPYNGHLYLSGVAPDATSLYDYYRLTSLFVFDKLQWKMIKEIPVLPDASDHPDAPTNAPYDLGFTTSGYGIVLLYSNGSSGSRWKVIDSANDDSIYVHPDRSGEFSAVRPNYNYRKLLFDGRYGSTSVTILDEEHTFTRISPFYGDRGVAIIPHRKEDRVFLGQLNEQFFMDSQGATTRLPTLAGISENGDFSYREGEESIMYFCDEGYLYVNDFQKGVTKLKTTIRYGVEQFTTTADGQYALTYVIGNEMTHLLIFDTSFFDPIKD